MFVDWDEYLQETDNVITGNGFESLAKVIRQYGSDVLLQFTSAWLDGETDDFDKFRKKNKSLSYFI
jgi:hypothetical protein